MVLATATSTSVSSSVAAGLRFGQAVQLTATVVPASGSDPTGSVSFFANGDPLGSSPVTTSATGVTGATVDVSSLPVGSDSITATYGGDVVFATSTSPALTQVVNPDPTNLTITPSSTSPEPGQPVIDTATVSLVTPGTGTPTGTVSFTDDGSPVAGCQSLSLPSVAPLQVACTETYESGATHSIVASYSGDEDDAGSNASLRPGGRSGPDADDRRVIVAHLDLRPERDADGHGDPDGDGIGHPDGDGHLL